MNEIVAHMLARLESRSSIDRLRAARQLAGVPLTALEKDAVRARLSDEVDAWVRTALVRVLESSLADDRASTAGLRVDPMSITNERDGTAEAIRQTAVASVANLLLHEIRPIVGRLEARVMREVPDYSQSRAAIEIGRLQKFLDTLARLADVSRAPHLQPFDLSVAIRESVVINGLDESRVLLARTDSVASFGDWDLIEFAFVNGLRNALEASAKQMSSVVVNWGTTDGDSWFAILDEGVGVPVAADLFAPGVTTKSRTTNQGWGLAIARQAISNLGGQITLSPRDSGGAAFEVRWPLEGVIA